MDIASLALHLSLSLGFKRMVTCPRLLCVRDTPKSRSYPTTHLWRLAHVWMLNPGAPRPLLPFYPMDFMRHTIMECDGVAVPCP